ncbi:MAG: hypothetical protein ACD_62C00232G0004 [uncultured bacterium]|nr:MAG: hypothetical protein ACD_62C00232G0004 [uncultured bacterium]
MEPVDEIKRQGHKHQKNDNEQCGCHSFTSCEQVAQSGVFENNPLDDVGHIFGLICGGLDDFGKFLELDDL